jgi:hypothetical protein
MAPRNSLPPGEPALLIVCSAQTTPLRKKKKEIHPTDEPCSINLRAIVHRISMSLKPPTRIQNLAALQIVDTRMAITSVLHTSAMMHSNHTAKG